MFSKNSLVRIQKNDAHFEVSYEKSFIETAKFNAKKKISQKQEIYFSLV